MNNLSWRYLPRLDEVSPADLARLFPEPSSTGHFLSLLEESGVDGFKQSSIVVLQADVPVLLLPLFETRFDLSAFVEGWLKKMLQVAGFLVPSIFKPTLLCVGSLVGEWSEIGIDSRIDAGTLAAAGTMAFAVLQTIASERKSDVVALYNFNQYGRLPGEVFRNFTQVHYRSCASLTIDFSSMEEYLGRLSRGARKDLRRKMRVAAAVQVVRSRSIAPWLDKVYKLYLETVERSPMAFGALNRAFFEKICEAVPGAEYTLYFVEEKLVAFNLLVVKQEAMEDKFFCMDYRLGRQYNLYFLSWLENVRICVEQKIPVYHAGMGTEEVKSHLGATFIQSYILFRHRQPLLDRFLMAWPAINGKLLSQLGFWPKTNSSSNPAKLEPNRKNRRQIHADQIG